MPQFMDFHLGPETASGSHRRHRRGAHNGTTDEFGVRQVELFHNPDGKVYCLLDAPNAQAVRDHHAALGVDCGEVHEVSGIG